MVRLGSRQDARCPRRFSWPGSVSADESSGPGFGKRAAAVGPGAPGDAGMKGARSLCGGFRAVGEETGGDSGRRWRALRRWHHCLMTDPGALKVLGGCHFHRKASPNPPNLGLGVGPQAPLAPRGPRGHRVWKLLCARLPQCLWEPRGQRLVSMSCAFSQAPVDVGRSVDRWSARLPRTAPWRGAACPLLTSPPCWGTEDGRWESPCSPAQPNMPGFSL